MFSIAFKAIASGFGKIPGKFKLWLIIILIGLFQYHCMYKPVKEDLAASEKQAEDRRDKLNEQNDAIKELHQRTKQRKKRAVKKVDAVLDDSLPPECQDLNKCTDYYLQ
jgi:hypothetical protein